MWGMLKTRRQCVVTMGACVAVWLVLGLVVLLTPPAVSDPLSPVAGVVDLVALFLLVAAAIQFFRLRPDRMSGERATAQEPTRR